MITKLSNMQIFEAITPINALLKESLPVKVSFNLLKTINKLNELLTIINIKREEILKSNCEVDEKNNLKLQKDGNNIDIVNTVIVSNPEKLNKEMDALFSIQNEVEVTLINISDISHLKYSAQELIKFEWLLTDK